MTGKLKLWLLGVVAVLVPLGAACTMAAESLPTAPTEATSSTHEQMEPEPAPDPPSSLAALADLPAFPDISQHTVPL